MMKNHNDVAVPTWVLPVMLALASWSGWVTTQLYGRPTFEQVDVTVATTAPYVKDRNLILAALGRTEKQVDRLVIEVQELKVELQKQ